MTWIKLKDSDCRVHSGAANAGQEAVENGMAACCQVRFNEEDDVYEAWILPAANRGGK